MYMQTPEYGLLQEDQLKLLIKQIEKKSSYPVWVLGFFGFFLIPRADGTLIF